MRIVFSLVFCGNVFDNLFNQRPDNKYTRADNTRCEYAQRPARAHRDLLQKKRCRNRERACSKRSEKRAARFRMRIFFQPKPQPDQCRQ